MDSIGSQPPSSSPRKRTESDSTSSLEESPRYGEWDVRRFDQDPMMYQDYSLSSLPQTPMYDRQVSSTDIPSLEAQWHQLKEGFHQEYAQAQDADKNDVLEQYVGKAGSITRALFGFSVIKAKLSEVEAYETLLNDVLQELTPKQSDSSEAATLGAQGKANHSYELTECCDQLKARQNLNAMLPRSTEVSGEITRLKSCEEPYLKVTPRNPQKLPSPPATEYQKLDEQMNQVWDDLKFLGGLDGYPLTPDVAWIASNYARNVQQYQAGLQRVPEGMAECAGSYAYVLRSLQGTNYYLDCESLYQQTATVQMESAYSSLHQTLSEENIPTLGHTPSDSLRASLLSGGPAGLTAAVFTPPLPKFEYKPLTVANYEKDRPLQLKAITPQMAKDFQEMIAKESYGFFDFRSDTGELFSRITPEGDLSFVKGFGPGSFLSQVFDTNDADGIHPYLHSQVHVTRPDGRHSLGANRISYDGEPAGIAMKAPRETDVPNVLQMAWENDTHVFVDLLADRDRPSRSGNPRFDWKNIPGGAGVKIGEFTVAREGEEVVHEFNSKVTEWSGERPAKAFVRTFRLTDKNGESKVFRQIGFPDWPDGNAIDEDRMDELLNLIEREENSFENHRPNQIVVNCKAGVGRTGTLFAARHLRQMAQRDQLDPEQLDAHVLQTILEGKLYRNEQFVQYPSQARLVSAMAKRYAAQQSFVTPGESVPVASPSLPEALPKGFQIGECAVEPVTEEMGQDFAKKLEDFLDDYDARKQRYDAANAPGVPDTEFDAAFAAYEEVHNTLLPVYTKYMTEAMVTAGMPEEQAQAIQHSLHIRQRSPDIVLEDKGNPYYYGSDPEPYSKNRGMNESQPRDDMACPLTHTQVKVASAEGQEVKLCGNHITIAGKDMGIAMQAPRYEEMDLVLHAAVSNDIGVHVDLVSTPDRRKLDERMDAEPAVNWMELEEFETERYVLTPNSQAVPFPIRHEGEEYQFVHRGFRIQPKDGGEARMLDQYTLIDWPDGQPLPHPVLKQALIPLRGKKIMVNCISGVGRTGSLFAGKHIDEEVSASGSGKGRQGQLALEGIMHTRLSRSGSAVSSPYQARELFRLEESY